jgi:hypothetical protein
MSTHTAHTPHPTARPRASAGQRGAWADSPVPQRERHSLESLISDIDTYLAEQEAYGRAQPGLRRTASRGTMFVDVREDGEMVVSYRLRHGQRDPHPHPHPHQHHARFRGEGERPEAEAEAEGGLYVLGCDGGDADALPYGVGHRTHHPHTRHLSAPAPAPARTEHCARPRATDVPRGIYAGSETGAYPRPMRRVENKPLPSVPRGHRKRTSLLDRIRGVVRKLCGEKNKGGRRRGYGGPRSTATAGFVRDGRCA